MRLLLIVLTCACLVAVGAPSTAADSVKLGRVIYIKTVGDESAAPSDVWEKDLDTGDNRIIVSHKALPKGFETRAETALLSPSGRYLYVSECSGVVIKSGRRQYGSTFAFVNGEEKTAKWIGSAHWCLDRKTGKWTRIVDGGSISCADVSWSPSRDLLMIGYEQERARLYDPATRKSTFLPKQEEMMWAGQGGGLISIIEGKEGHSVGVRVLGGKRRPIFTCSDVWSIAQSFRGTFALYDGKSFSLLDGKGKRLARLPIKVPDYGCFNATFSFSPGGTRLIISTSHSYGEPAFNQDDATWLVDIATVRVTQLDRTGGSFGFSDEDEVGSFCPDGWIDERSAVVVESTVPGITYDSESWKCSYAVYIRDITAPAKSKSVFDTGTSCIALSWWAGRNIGPHK